MTSLEETGIDTKQRHEPGGQKWDGWTQECTWHLGYSLVSDWIEGGSLDLDEDGISFEFRERMIVLELEHLARLTRGPIDPGLHRLWQTRSAHYCLLVCR